QSDHILQLAAIEQNNLEYRFGEVDLIKIVDEAIQSVDFLVEQKGGKITRDYGTDPVFILGDHNELVHVLMNLLVNAYKYSHQKIEITVAIRRAENGILVDVIDKGIGIAPNEKKKIFEKYYRISSGNQHNTKGFGIGLYYVKEVLKAHHAPIHVESEPGKGSRFSILFPKEGKKKWS
ncbi:MAG: HAMP domain-containing histidine kinase, partial [Bacteroidetes bacterium]|nr:HAMP domain-containing histidine kinase [Bacteroidota bacterium]